MELRVIKDPPDGIQEDVSYQIPQLKLCTVDVPPAPFDILVTSQWSGDPKKIVPDNVYLDGIIMSDASMEIDDELYELSIESPTGVLDIIRKGEFVSDIWVPTSKVVPKESIIIENKYIRYSITHEVQDEIMIALITDEANPSCGVILVDSGYPEDVGRFYTDFDVEGLYEPHPYEKFILQRTK